MASAFPEAIVTLPGTVAAPVLLLDREITAPALGAGVLIVTVPVEELPPFTLVGFSATELMVIELVDGGGPPILVLLLLLHDSNRSEIATSPSVAAEIGRPRESPFLRPNPNNSARQLVKKET